MPEDNQATSSQTQQTVQEQNQQSQIPVELKQQMETSLRAFVPGMQTSAPVEVKTDAAVQPTLVTSESTEQTTDVPAVVQPTEPFSILKEKYGWQKPEDALAEIDQLRAFKQNPITPADIEFANEDSEKLFKAIIGGKRKDVYQILDKIERLESLTSSEVTKDNASDIIKFGMFLKNPTLTPDEIDYRYNKQFTIPKAPIQDTVNETDEEFAVKKAQWQEQVSDIEMNRRIEAKLILPELEAAKKQIILPEIDNTVDEGYVQYRKMLEDEPKLNKEIKEAYGKINPKALETKIKFTDEPNKIDFEFQYEPDGESSQKTIDIASDINKLIEHFRKPDGTPDREGFAKAMHFALNHSKMLTEAMNQSKNATIKSLLPDNRNGGTQRQFPQRQEPSELDKQMQMSLALNGQRR